MNLSTVDITRTLNADSKTRNVFLCCTPCDAIPYSDKFPYAIVVNTDTSRGPGKHWVVIYAVSPNVVEYFDSFAASPIPQIARYLDGFRTVLRNPKQIQGNDSYVCGCYCIYYIMMRTAGQPLSMICHKLKSNPNPDNYVAFFYYSVCYFY